MLQNLDEIDVWLDQSAGLETLTRALGLAGALASRRVDNRRTSDEDATLIDRIEAPALS